MPKCGSATVEVVCLAGTTSQIQLETESTDSCSTPRPLATACHGHPDREKYGSPPLLGYAVDDSLGDIETAAGHCCRAATKDTPDGHRKDRPEVRCRPPRWKTSKSWRLCHDPPGARHDS